MVVRCTAKALKLLGAKQSSLAQIEPGDDDWYVNLLWFERRKCLLLTHAGTVFSVFVPDVRKADLDPLGPFLVEAITLALDAESLPYGALGELDGADVRIARTASRRVLGFMNEIAWQVEYSLGRYGSILDIDVITLQRQLQRTLHNHGGRYATPADLVAERLGPSYDS